MCELAYLRGPAMFDVATKAHEAQMQERSRAEKEGATAQQAWSLSFDRWPEVLRREAELHSFFVICAVENGQDVLSRARSSLYHFVGMPPKGH
jgi:hypothetical protein